ncbi:integrase [Pseudomonas profundi]|uniref:integrase n=1 Tax=Pseudomonas profundi TaxID=1981513 RepID=UPI0012397B35|nr:integrase [Pseudomonas profundi]
MAKRKSYLLDERDESNITSIVNRVRSPDIIRLEGSVHAIKRNLDVGRLYGLGCDEVVEQLHQALWELYGSGTRSISSIETYFVKGLEPFVAYLAERAKILGRDITLSDISLPLMEEYVHFLGVTIGKTGKTLSFATQRVRFSSIRTLLVYLSKKGVLPARHRLIPASPYPNVARRTKGERALSESERRALQVALLQELGDIHAGKSELRIGEQLTVHLLLIAAATGRNTVSLLELNRDALRSHPLREDRWLLITHKRRGRHTHTQSFATGDEGGTTVKAGVVRLFQSALAISAEAAEKAPSARQERLWLYEHKGQLTSLNQQALSRYGGIVAAKHNLRRDDGSPLRITVGALRKTFVNRLWKLSGGDPFVTARLAGHTIEVSNSHYLAVTPEMERNHKFCGIALVESLRGDGNVREERSTPSSIVPTGVAHCSDPMNGRFAPKDDSPCTDFLSCFRCPNQVVTQDDLYRLFSFYWLLIKERAFLGATRWTKLYGWVIRDIDDVISEKFPLAAVSKARERAKNTPHPMWKDRAMLGVSDV